ncbi:hypothetical protein U0070_001333 [Myodes glareolus]|uniref:Uncharacterized protein n=1 Tax=Myodes glareolus TaxID=447135 RepID=A0AAW0HZ66_MYOGA
MVGVVVECFPVQGLQEGHVQMATGLDELLRQAQLLLQHVIQHQHCRAGPQKVTFSKYCPVLQEWLDTVGKE